MYYTCKSSLGWFDASLGPGPGPIDVTPLEDLDPQVHDKPIMESI